MHRKCVKQNDIMTRKKKEKSHKLPNLTDAILQIFKKSSNKVFNYKQIAAKLNITDTSGRNQIIKTIKKLKAKQKIEEIDRGQYKVVGDTEYFTGILDLTARGQGYVICEEFEEDVFVPNNKLNKALNGDEVEIYVYKRRKNNRPEGEITNIIKRKKTEFVGVLQMQKNFAFVVASDSKMYTDIFVPKNKINNAEDGDKVVVEIEDWPARADSPFGKIIKVLGKPGEHNTEIAQWLSST